MGLEHKIIIWPDVPLSDQQRTGWAEDARRYEDEPDDFFAAWHYVNNHPMFWHFQGYVAEGQPKASDFVTDNWGFGSMAAGTQVRRSLPPTAPAADVDVARVDEDGHARNDESLSLHTEVWLEAGHIVMQPNPAMGWQNDHYHDYELDCGAATYEEAVIKLARNIWEKYGNDREVADKQ